MPVVRTTIGAVDLDRHKPVWEALARELAAPKPFGQPMVRIETFLRTGLQGVTVIWDRIQKCPDTDRPAVIVRAFEAAFGAEAKDKIAFGVGWTVAEAARYGLLPWGIRVREGKTDLTRAQQAIDAVFGVTRRAGSRAERAGRRPILRFQTEEQAYTVRDKLVEQWPGSKDAWEIVSYGVPDDMDG